MGGQYGQAVWALADSGTPFSSGIASYTVGVFGQASPRIVLDVTVRRPLSRTSISQSRESTACSRQPLTGAQPSLYTSKGKTVRALAQENDKAFALLNALDETQRKQAILNYQIGDLMLKPGHADETIQPEGLKAVLLNEKQRAMLLDVISEWAGIINDVFCHTPHGGDQGRVRRHVLCPERTDHA